MTLLVGQTARLGGSSRRNPWTYQHSLGVVANYQLEEFRLAYKSLENSEDEVSIHKNQQMFREIYGELPSKLEREWLNGLRAEKK
jgi:hypothetical protein